MTPDTVEAARDWIAARIDAEAPFRIASVEDRGGDWLCSAKLDRVRFFEPDDMVIGVEAGIPFTRLHAKLIKRNMMVPVNPWYANESVGAVVAANRFGPHRMSAGGIRDSIIGIETINGSAMVVKAGGKVVKNVTGYDLGKLMVGSLGGLGLITAVHFKLMPAPVEPHTLVVRPDDVSWLTRFQDSVHLKGLPLDWVQAVCFQGQWQLGIGISGNQLRRARLIEEMEAAMGAVTVVPDHDLDLDRAWFAPSHRFGGFLMPHLKRHSPNARHLHATLPMSSLPAVAQTWSDMGLDRFSLVVHPVGADFHWVASELEPDGVERLAAAIREAGGYLDLVDVPREVRARFGMVVPLPPEYELIQRLKRAVDPKDVFRSDFYVSPDP